LPKNSMAVLHSTGKDDWMTPPWLVALAADRVRAPFALDGAASSTSAKAPLYCGPDHEDPRFRNGLTADWKRLCNEYGQADGPVWVNPPYSRHVGQWIRKCYDESRKGLTVALTVFARTETTWWADYLWKADEIDFIRARLLVWDPGTGLPRHPAPAPSILAIFRPHVSGPPRVSNLWQPPEAKEERRIAARAMREAKASKA
jgi:phage N-6-adenine-methyltransferase